jgi:hypothetical protein
LIAAMTMTSMRNHCLVALCALGVGLAAGCATSDDGDLTDEQVATLPDDSDVDHAQLPELLAAEPPLDDAALFDTADAVDIPDEPVDDNDEGAVALTLEPRATTLLKFGLHPRASDAFRAVGVSASRILQTIGNAAASAGTHAQDGTVNGHPYSAATDLSVSGLSNAQIRNLLERMAKVGFAAWFRQPGHDGWPASEVRHIHAVYANAKMKASLRSQVRSWLAGRNGLVSNTLYGFYHWTTAAKDTVRRKFAQSASGTTNAGSSCFVGGSYCGGDKISGDPSTLFRCTGVGAPTVIRKCARGCAVRPGQDDACR